MTQARTELEALAASRNSANSECTEAEERQHEAVRVRQERQIAFLKEGVGGPSGMMTAHRNRGLGLPLEVIISAKQTGARHAGTGGSFAVLAVSATSPAGSAVTNLPENYALEVHPLETVGSLRKRMAAVNGFGSLSEFTRLTCGKTLSGDTQTMLEVGVTDGTGIWTILSAASAQGVVRASQMERHPMGETERHYGDVIAGQSVLFDELFRLLECARGLKVCVCVCVCVCVFLAFVCLILCGCVCEFDCLKNDLKVRSFCLALPLILRPRVSGGSVLYTKKLTGSYILRGGFVFLVLNTCRAVPCRAVPCRAVPCRAVPCRAVPCRAVVRFLFLRVLSVSITAVCACSEVVQLTINRKTPLNTCS